MSLRNGAKDNILSSPSTNNGRDFVFIGRLRRIGTGMQKTAKKELIKCSIVRFVRSQNRSQSSMMRRKAITAIVIGARTALPTIIESITQARKGYYTD